MPTQTGLSAHDPLRTFGADEKELRFANMKLPLAPLFLLTSCAVQPQEEWTSTMIDGRARSDFQLVIRGGDIVGGHDSCNGWGRSDQEGLVTIDLEECPEDPLRNAYWVLATGEGTTITRQGARLVARNKEHVGIFVKLP